MASVVQFALYPHMGEWSPPYGGSIGPPSVLTCGTSFAVSPFGGVDTHVYAPRNVDVTLPTERYYFIIEYRVQGLNAGYEGDEGLLFQHGPGALFSGLNLRVYGTVGGGGSYKLRLYDGATLIGEGSTTWSPSTTWRWARGTLIPGSQAALEIEGTLEVNAATTKTMPSGLLGFGGGPAPYHAGSFELRKVVVVRGDSGDDRPDAGAYEVLAVYTNGNGALTAWTGTEADWDDWDACGTNDGDTTKCVAPLDADGDESSTHPALSLTYTPRGLALYQLSRVSVTGNKSLGSLLIHDGTNTRIVSLGNVGNDLYNNGSYGVFNKAPDGSDWSTQARVNATEIGRRGKGITDSYDLYCTAIAGELACYSLDAGDPPALPSERRRALGQVI